MPINIYNKLKCNLKPVAFMLLLLSITLIINQLNLVDAPSLNNWAMQNNNMMLIVLASCCLMIICAISPLPTEAVAMTNGILLGPLLGILVTWSSGLLGAYIAFSISRYLKNKTHKSKSREIQQIQQCVNKWGPLGFLVARLIPTIPFFLLNVIGPYLPISSRTFVFVTALSTMFYAIIFCNLGWYTTTS